MNDSPFPQIPSITVSVNEVVNLLQHLDPHKATGPDEIPAYFLKELSYEIALILTLIFQSSLHQGSLLEEWKTANIIPIFKRVIVLKSVTTVLSCKHLYVGTYSLQLYLLSS